MNTQDKKYTQFALCREMLETVSTVKNMDIAAVKNIAEKITKQKIFFTGEGSSRIFPAKKTMYDAQKNGYSQFFNTEGATQALEYDLADSAIFVASNSGKTKEGVRLIAELKKKRHDLIIGVIANAGTPIMAESHMSYVLTCGKENAVAATKSVVEQALFYDILFRLLNNKKLPDMNHLAEAIEEALTAAVPAEITEALVKAPMLYFAGRNNGVAEELTLKTNEITRKKSDFLEGTYAVHGIEEVMNKNEAVIIINPFKDENKKFSEVLEKGVGLKVLSIATEKTDFPCLCIPEYNDFTNYIELAAGWNLLVETGIALGIDLDKPERARKVGNEYQPV